MIRLFITYFYQTHGQQWFSLVTLRPLISMSMHVQWLQDGDNFSNALLMFIDYFKIQSNVLQISIIFLQYLFSSNNILKTLK